jgi:hypothetical protein
MTMVDRNTLLRIAAIVNYERADAATIALIPRSKRSRS